MARAERALVLLKPQFLGDAVMACPLIDSLASPYAETVAMCGPLVQELLRDRQGLVRFETGSKISGINPVLRTARQLRRLQIQHAYIVNRSFRSALAVRLAGIPVRIGHSTEGRGVLLTHRVVYDEVKFEAMCYLDLAFAMGLPTADSQPKVRLVDDDRPCSPDKPGTFVAIQPGARYLEKQVPIPVMAEVCKSLAEEGYDLHLLGGKEEDAQAAELKALAGVPMVDLVGQLPLRSTMATLAAARAVIGSDTGLMHVAAALGTPTVTVFGPNPASKWGHDYPPHHVLEAPGGDIRQMDAQTILTAVRKILDGLSSAS